MNPGEFRETARDSMTRARCGVLATERGKIETPVFMPVGTHATVKTLTGGELCEAGAEVILCNAYHLFLRPGVDLIEAMGGLHRFMNWQKPILTDSGGFQIFSLQEQKKITEEGLRFKSHLDGQIHFLSPESVLEIQQRLGVDIAMPLDECVSYPADEARVTGALKTTQIWWKRSYRAWNEARGNRPGFCHFGIIQGGVYLEHRKRALEDLIPFDATGFAVGGLSVGEPQKEMVEVLTGLGPLWPKEKPRYLMGVGYPGDMVLAVEQGVDMFDCVAPTRNGRNGTVFVPEGRLLLRNAEFSRDERPIDPECECDACQNYSRAYLRHLFMAKEILALRMASLHNVTFCLKLLKSMRKAIKENGFLAFKNKFFSRYRIDEQPTKDPE